MRYAAVHVNKPLETPYTYRVPARLAEAVAPGSRVEVSLGRGKAMGVVVALSDELPEGLPAARVKPLLRVLEVPAALDEGLLALGARLAEYYLCAPGEAYHAMVPSYSLPQPPPRFRLAGDATEILAQLSPRAKKQELLVKAMVKNTKPVTRRKLVQIGGASAVKALEDRGFLEKLGREVAALTPPAAPPGEPPGVFPELRERQREAHEAIAADLEAGRHRTHLLHGVTGSGKTEVYLAAIRDALVLGRTALFLIPEIALTVAMIEKVRERLGPLLAVLHSRMGGKERYQEWARARTGEARVVLGPRSAVFAPLPDLGLVILDEEQENSYKQQDKPRYHAREVAIWRGQAAGFPVILGSATPSLESFLAGQQGDYVAHRLPQRFRQGDDLPPVTLVDMADEFREKKNKSVFSGPLKERLDATLERGGQALLFMNRRGYHTYVFCRTCGYVLECRDCSVALTFHLERHDCLCHHCGFRAAAPRQCPECESRAIRYAGTGTQRVAREFALNFPDVRFARMDSDTTRGKGSHESILGDYSAGRTKVLIGTQMLAKGFDFPRLHFVGVVNADGGLTMPDFRGAEKTFQLLTQVAGRCGRGDERGEVVVQTYRPEHYALQAAKKHDYEEFAGRELPVREELFYPPYSRLVLVSAEAPTEDKAADPLDAMRDHLEEVVTGVGKLRLMGPAPAPLQRIEKKHRWQLLIKLERTPEALAKLQEGLRSFSGGLTDLKVDVDPMNLL